MCEVGRLTERRQACQTKKITLWSGGSKLAVRGSSKQSSADWGSSHRQLEGDDGRWVEESWKGLLVTRLRCLDIISQAVDSGDFSEVFFPGNR